MNIMLCYEGSRGDMYINYEISDSTISFTSCHNVSHFYAISDNRNATNEGIPQAHNEGIP